MTATATQIEAVAPKPPPVPFRIVIDTREQLPFAFADLRSDAALGRRPLLISTITSTLTSGDYSIEGLEQSIAIERKSLADAFGTFGRHRKRFERELHRLSSTCEYAAVVVEGDWQEIVTAPPNYSKLPAKSVYRSVLTWSIRYPRVHWWMCPGRRFAEITTFRLLEKFWREKQRSSNSVERDHARVMEGGK